MERITTLSWLPGWEPLRAAGEEGSLRSPVVGLRAACPHVLADPTSLPSISGHQAHSDPRAFPTRVIQVPFLLLLTPGVTLTLLPVTLSLTPPHHFLSRP